SRAVAAADSLTAPDLPATVCPLEGVGEGCQDGAALALDAAEQVGGALGLVLGIAGGQGVGDGVQTEQVEGARLGYVGVVGAADLVADGSGCGLGVGVAEPVGDLGQGLPGDPEGEGVGEHWSPWSSASRRRACCCPVAVPCPTATTAPHVARRLGW